MPRAHYEGDPGWMGVNGGDWRRLGSYLTQRRVGLGYRLRSPFQDAVAGTSGQRRTIVDAESGRRHDYDAVTVAWIEHIYQWRPGSVAAVLDGAEPRCLEDIEVDDCVVVAINGDRQVRQRQRRHAFEGFGAPDVRLPDVELAILYDATLAEDDAGLLIDLYRRMQRGT